jgi:ABC-type transporter Mla subunit MlaD
MNSRLSDAVFGGFLVAAGLGLSVFMALGGIHPDLLRPHTLFHAELDQGSGITGGMHVTVIGRRVGYVSEIELTDDRTVAISFLVESRYAHHVRMDSEVGVIRTLAGRSVDIGMGEGDAAVEGSTLPGGRNIDPLLLVQASDLDANFHRLERILSDLTAISEQIGLGDGEIGEQISRMITQVESGRGTVGKLLMDDQASEDVFAALADIDRMATDLSAAAKELQGTGVALTEAAQPLASAGSELSTVAVGLQGSTQKLDGALVALTKSLSNLDRSMQQLDKTLVAIQHMPIVRGQVKKLDREEEGP